MIPFQITFLDFPESDAVWVAIQNRVEKLEHFYDRIVRCEVTVACPHRHRKMNRLYHVQIHLSIPGEDVYVNRNPSKNEAHRDIYVAIRDTFNAAERILQDKVRIVRHKVKFHEPTSTEGKISKIFYSDGFGFVETSDHRECYFGENSITNENFNQLKIGQRVRFHEEPGAKGPQVTSMTVIQDLANRNFKRSKNIRPRQSGAYTFNNLKSVSDKEGHYDIDGVSLEMGIKVIVASDGNHLNALRN